MSLFWSQSAKWVPTSPAGGIRFRARAPAGFPLQLTIDQDLQPERSEIQKFCPAIQIITAFWK